jgi:hypothetical protein
MIFLICVNLKLQLFWDKGNMIYLFNLSFNKNLVKKMKCHRA